MNDTIRYNRVGIRIIEVPRKPRKPRQQVHTDYVVEHTPFLPTLQWHHFQLAIQFHNEVHGNYCFYCGRFMTDEIKTFDHVVPRSAGGAGVYPNKVACCRNCNAGKGAMTVESFREIKLEGRVFWGETQYGNL